MSNSDSTKNAEFGPGEITPTWLNRWKRKLMQTGLIVLNTLIPYVNWAEPNSFGDIWEELLSDRYVLFLVTTAMFFFHT